jgi:hypothetical protein
MTGRQSFSAFTCSALAVFVVAACAGPVATSTPDSPSAAATLAPGTQLTDEELGVITQHASVPIPSDAPQPRIDAVAAEATVRATYTGSRVTIEVRRIAMRIQARIVTGWLVGLTPRAGAACDLHPGLLPRAIEGGIVDDQEGDMFWSMICG